MDPAAKVLHDASSYYGQQVEALNLKSMTPQEQKLIAAIIGGVTQAVLAKLSEALLAASTPTIADAGSKAVDAIIQPPLPPLPRRAASDAWLGQTQAARQDAIRDYAQYSSPPSSAPPSSQPVSGYYAEQ